MNTAPRRFLTRLVSNLRHFRVRPDLRGLFDAPVFKEIFPQAKICM
jgi:hypothetical protein